MNKPANLKNKKNNVEEPKSANGALLLSQVRQEFSGPLPHPSIFAEYERILPGAAERLLSQTEIQSKHRRDLETIAIKSGSRDSLIGLISAFFLGAGSLLAGTIVILKGYAYPGSFFGLLGMGSLTTAFIYGTRSNRKERQEKFKNS